MSTEQPNISTNWVKLALTSLLVTLLVMSFFDAPLSILAFIGFFIGGPVAMTIIKTLFQTSPRQTVKIGTITCFVWGVTGAVLGAGPVSLAGIIGYFFGCMWWLTGQELNQILAAQKSRPPQK